MFSYEPQIVEGWWQLNSIHVGVSRYVGVAAYTVGIPPFQRQAVCRPAAACNRQLQLHDRSADPLATLVSSTHQLPLTSATWFHLLCGAVVAINIVHSMTVNGMVPFPAWITQELQAVKPSLLLLWPRCNHYPTNTNFIQRLQRQGHSTTSCKEKL